jgi:hypothetical protein
LEREEEDSLEYRGQRVGRWGVDVCRKWNGKEEGGGAVI